jgi:hypothetical protein
MSTTSSRWWSLSTVCQCDTVLTMLRKHVNLCLIEIRDICLLNIYFKAIANGISKQSPHQFCLMLGNAAEERKVCLLEK